MIPQTQIFDESYLDARDIIIDLTGLLQETFPVTPIATVDEALNESWLPGMI